MKLYDSEVWRGMWKGNTFITGAGPCSDYLVDGPAGGRKAETDETYPDRWLPMRREQVT